jgi:hypothetical protein
VTLATLLLLLFGWNRITSTRLARQVEELQREKTELAEYLRRLCTSRRVAQIDVLDRGIEASGELVTRLSWQEIGEDGVLSRPKFIEVLGNLVYVEAMVIKFEFEHVATGDAEKGASVAVFRRVFGERQSPDSGPILAPRVAPSEDGRGPGAADDPRFAQFWDFVDDAELAAKHGVRVAQCEAVGAHLRPGEIWEVTLDAAGGLNLMKLRDGSG